ncbi:phage tail protein, partial [Staphylococcus xylosus]
MFIRDLEDNEYFLEGVIEHEHDLNGDERVDIDIHYTATNELFLKENNDLKMWTILFDNKKYKIISSNIITKGDYFYVSCTAILHILDWLNTNRIYNRYDKSFPASKAFDLIFADSPFSYILVDKAKAESFEGLGDGDTRLNVFKKLLNRYSYEMYIDGDVVYLKSRIGHDTNFEYRYQLNASNLKKEVDASAMYTYGIGYADYEDDEENVQDKANIKREYTSPLAKIIGKRHAEPIKDGRIKYESVLDKKIRYNVDSSVNISVTADIYNLSKQGYDYQYAKIGDRVFLIDERIGLNTEIRIVKILKSISSNGQILDIEITFGSQPLSDTYPSKFNSAISNINELLEGRRALPFNALDTVSKAMVKNIQSASTEVKFDNGIHAIDKDNPNEIISLASKGIMLSQDGG